MPLQRKVRLQRTHATITDAILRNQTYTSGSEDYVSIHSFKLKDVELDNDASYVEINEKRALAEKAM